MQTTSDTLMVPYSKLRHSSRNVRTRDEQYYKTLPELADSIEAVGVLENLIASEHHHGKQVHYEVEAGGRRLDALGILFERGAITKRTLIPVNRVNVGDSVAISLIENVQRVPLHKADEIVAFKKMVDDNKTIEEVATRFDVTPLVVQRRLRLANVAPRFLEMFRKNEIIIDVLTALAITDDHERQSQVWDALPQYSRNARDLRAALTENQVSVKHDPVAQYVGAKSYEKAGGAITRDLFSDENDGYMLDAALLHQLAQAKLQKKADEVKTEGFAWVEPHIHLDYSERRAFGKIGTVARAANKKEGKKIEDLKTRIAELEASDDESDETLDALQDARDALEEIEAGLQVPDPAQQAVAGAIVTIGDDGKAEVLRGLLKPEDARAFKAGKKPAEADDDGKAGDDDNDLSARLTLRLTAQLTAGLQLAAARTPHAALALVVYSLAEGFTATSRDALHLHLTPANLRMHDEGIENAAAAKELQSLTESVLDEVRDKSYAWFLEQSTERLLEILAVSVAPGIDAVNNSGEMTTEVAALARATKLDMADWWQPTADTYLRFVKKPQIVASVGEGVSQEAAAEVSKAKTKALMVTMAETQLAGRRWLPTVMRT